MAQERRYLPSQYLTLQLQQDSLRFGKAQTEMLNPLVLLVQHNDVIDGHLFVIGHHHSRW